MRAARWMLSARLLAFMAAALLAACRIGPDPGNSVVATNPRGVDLEIRWDAPYQSRWGGQAELVSVTDREIYVIHGSTVVRYPFGTPARARARGARGVGTLNLLDPDADTIEEFRQYARYPFGLAESRLSELARAMGTEQVVTVSYFGGQP